MKIFPTLLVSIFFVTYSLAQPAQVKEEFNSSYYELHGLEINLTSDKILITHAKQDVFFEDIIGKKIFQKSPAENYFLISNFKFSNKKVDYPVEIKVFDSKGNFVFPYKFIAPYDLPHPLFCLNDNALLALFDPLSFKVKLIGDDSYNELELLKDVPFEMEKASFVEMNEDFLFILTSQSALDITENASNVKLYGINLFDLNVVKKELDYNTPTLLKIIGGNLFVSGVKFENLKPVGKTIKYDLRLNQLASNEMILEGLILFENRFYAKYFNKIFELGSDLTISKEYLLFGNERILDIAKFNEKLLVVTNISGKNNLYYFSPDLSVDFKAPLDIFGMNKIDDFSVLGNHLIIHHDSKSVKLNLNEN